ncbi:hypothetical protein BOTBODRAFT_60799 [Botryobasidium botryosum FD-172 SS1]|uniref:Peptidase S9 prolyl oligopeptidase catalytic domain-containing protein n=1 Tax=Botryobasidium botryosum (strain FD-172 SS1) TaxID=930990 RepID=A0A067LSI7_BOTB1|nr:hypothetical protein BOTBODRAFT_60799 [Botryobasidium botryosum FD-172 SS1]
MVHAGQSIFQVSDGWQISISQDYDFLGPFPQSAREQHYLSPSFPIDIRIPYIHEKDAVFPSSLAENGFVGWSTQSSQNAGTYELVYPDVPWALLRSTQGWAGLQHHSLIHTTLTITPPDEPTLLPHSVLISLLQGSFFTVLPRDAKDVPIQWYTGNIYGHPSQPQSIPLSVDLSTSQPTILDLFISADYEIRLFGDPTVAGGRPEPISRLKLDAQLEMRDDVALGDSFILPDFMDGWALGDAVGIPLTSRASWVDVLGVECNDCEGAELRLQEPFRLAPYQTRMLPLRLSQERPLPKDVTLLHFTLRLSTPEKIRAHLPIRHHPHWSSFGPNDHIALKQTYFTPSPSMSLLLPPLSAGLGQTPPLLATHGAGVSIEEPFWSNAIPRQQHSWVVLPSGGTEWGYDWRGPSAADALNAVEALREREAIGKGIVVTGHSNGGQGAFYLASRFPDLFRAAIPATSYLSASLYVPTTYAHGVHFTDPVLGGILSASLVGGDNDVFLGNLARSRVRVIHGNSDENIPAWHSREAVSIVKSWDNNADISLTGIPERPHWWDEYFKEPLVSGIIHNLLQSPEATTSPAQFTLTVMWPNESGPMGGWQVREVETPGRLARISVKGDTIKTSNVWSFSVRLDRIHSWPKLVIDGVEVQFQHEPSSSDDAWFSKDNHDGGWKSCAPYSPRPAGPLSRILVSQHPITLIVPASNLSLLSLATRLAHGLYNYLRVDTRIVTDIEALDELQGTAPLSGNVIVFDGGHNNAYSHKVFSGDFRAFAFNAATGSFELRGRAFSDPGTGILFMHDSHLIIHATDLEGYERALRLFPLRTGVPNPEWLVAGKAIDTRGWGGILGAGFWDRKGYWSESMSWLA